jgi:hypothetical protein
MDVSNYAWDQLFVFNFLQVGKTSNVLGTFLKNLIILVARFIPFFSFDQGCVQV